MVINNNHVVGTRDNFTVKIVQLDDSDHMKVKHRIRNKRYQSGDIQDYNHSSSLHYVVNYQYTW